VVHRCSCSLSNSCKIPYLHKERASADNRRRFFSELTEQQVWSGRTIHSGRSEQEAGDDAESGGDQDDEDRVDVLPGKEQHQREDEGGNQKRRGCQDRGGETVREEDGGCRGYHGGADQADDCRLEAAHAAFYNAAAAELLIAFDDQKNDDEGGQDYTQGSAYGAQEAAGFGADIRGNVDSERAGRAFRNGDEVDQFLNGHPTVRGDLRFNQRQHRIAAAEGEGADLQKGQKQIQQDHA